MNRYLLDTNILIFLLLGRKNEISNEVSAICQDYSNLIYTSSICMAELTQLFRIGKIRDKKFKTAHSLFKAIQNELYIDILPFTKEHSETMSKLEISEKHNDPFDHSIISHAITNKLILVSSDRKFKDYIPQKLNFVFNKR